MEKLEGKYFENTINKLKEAKNAERIEMRGDFKLSLRAGLMEKAGLLPMTTDWRELVTRWKHLFGAVPVLAVLTIVAAGLFGQQAAKAPSSEVASQKSVQEVALEPSLLSSSSIAANVLAPDINGSEFTQSPGIITFSAALVMPPAGVLARLETRYQLEPTLSTYDSDLKILPTENDVTTKSLMFLSDLGNEIKLNPPKVNLFTFSFKNIEPTVNAFFMPAPVIVTSIASGIRLPDVTSVQYEIRSENNAKVEDSQSVETAAVVSQIDASFAQTENPAKASLAVNEGAYIDPARIIYDEMDRSMVNALVSEELSDKIGYLSDDYYVKVGKFDDNKLKISLFERGNATRIIFMEEDAQGEYKAVTVVNY